MSKKIKLKVKDLNRRGQKLNLPIDGKVEVSSDGEIEVSEECAQLILSGTDDFINESESKKPAKTKKPVEEVEEEEVEETEETEEEETEEEETEEEETEEEETEEEENEDEEGEETIDLNTLELPELIQLAKDADIKEPSYRKHKKSKKAMVAFLAERLA